METKVVKKRFDLAFFEEEQDFLGAEHKNGWKLISVKGGKYIFSPCDAKEYIYQLDFNYDNIEEEVYIQLYKDCGWEYVCKLGEWFYYRQERTGIENLCIFSDKESKIAMCQNIAKKQLSIISPFLFVVLAWNFILNCTDILDQYFSSTGIIIITCIGVVVILGCTYQFGISIANSNKLNKMMKELTNPINK